MLNGDGLRVVLWTAGCSHCCKDCQNPVTWDPNGGLPFTEAEEAEIFSELDKDYVSGITFSGGRSPASCQYHGCDGPCKEDPGEVSPKTIWLYTGSLWRRSSARKSSIILTSVWTGEFQVDKKISH